MGLGSCRICLTIGIFDNIFLTSECSLISVQIMSLAKIQVGNQIHQGDGLPETICPACIHTLKTCIQFVQLCKNSDKKLRRSIVLNNRKCPIEKDPLTIDVDSDLENTNLAIHNENNESSKQSTSLNSQTLLIEDTTASKEKNVVKVKEKENLQFTEFSTNNEFRTKSRQKQQCFTCGKVISSKFRLKTHLRTHSGERPFPCPHCSKSFSLAQNLKIHIRIHTGEKPLICDICGQGFAQSAGLATHKRKHTGQRPYQCTMCPRSFQTAGHLQYHIRRHTGEKNYECDTCARAFITRSDLKQHLLSHSGVRTHVCPICGLRFSRASHLKRHVQHVHKGNRAFACTVCKSEFAQKTELEKHKGKHEKIEKMPDTPDEINFLK